MSDPASKSLQIGDLIENEHYFSCNQGRPREQKDHKHAN